MKKESDFNRIEDLLNRNNDQMGELIESQNNEISEIRTMLNEGQMQWLRVNEVTTPFIEGNLKDLKSSINSTLPTITEMGNRLVKLETEKRYETGLSVIVFFYVIFKLDRFFSISYDKIYSFMIK